MQKIIEITNLNFTYEENSPLAREALNGINLSISKGSLVGLGGQTGSGKSTLVQLIAGLLPFKDGSILVDGLELKEKGNQKKIRSKVGMVFQYPEHQLFDETVLADVSFGPRNLGLPEPEMQALGALTLVGLDPREIANRSPFALSGGQRRRVAIAGVLAMEPEILILDEPTAGLDPEGRRQLLTLVERLHKAGQTIILISHRMQELAPLVERMVVLHEGRIILDGTADEVFTQEELLGQAALAPPPVTELMLRLKEQGWPVKTNVFSVLDAKRQILAARRQGC